MSKQKRTRANGSRSKRAAASPSLLRPEGLNVMVTITVTVTGDLLEPQLTKSRGKPKSAKA